MLCASEKCAKLYEDGFIVEANIQMLEALSKGNTMSSDTSTLFQNIRTDYRIVNDSIEVRMHLKKKTHCLYSISSAHS